MRKHASIFRLLVGYQHYPNSSRNTRMVVATPEEIDYTESLKESGRMVERQEFMEHVILGTQLMLPPDVVPAHHLHETMVKKYADFLTNKRGGVGSSDLFAVYQQTTISDDRTAVTDWFEVYEKELVEVPA